jgi:cytochrome c556
MVMALAVCHCESAPGPARRAAAPQAEPPAGDPQLRPHMASHFEVAVELQAAIAQGRLADARDKARWFAAHEMDTPPAWSSYIQEMRYAAMQIGRARDVPTAGAQIGRLGLACGSCHATERATLAFSTDPPPADVMTPEAQMDRHQWAAARLWEGLIGPADQRWLEGAQVMAATHFDVAKSAHQKPNAEVVELAERMREQATAAVEVTDLAARATLFGEMMDTCASCHSIVRPAPAVGARGK